VYERNPLTEDDAVKRFLSRYHPFVTAVLSGFDRLVLRGTLLPLVRDRGMFTFLCRANVRLLDFGDFVRRTSEQVKAASLRQAESAERPVRYLPSSRTDKEALARELLAQHPIDSGLVCAFKTVEPCMSFEYHRSPDPRERGLRLRPRKCLHIYHYYVHPWFGFLGARLQTWFPFAVQVCLKRTRVARPAVPPTRAHRLPPTRQLLHPARQPQARPAPDGRTAPALLEVPARQHRPPAQPPARLDLPALAPDLLLVRLPDRVGHRPALPRPAVRDASLKQLIAKAA